MRLFGKREDPHKLIVGMISVKMGDRILQIGCANGSRLAALAAKVGISGRAVAVVPDEARATRARRGAEQAGVLLEVEVAPLTQLPVEESAFDLAIIDDTDNLLNAMREDDRAAMIREVLRVLRPGGRVMVVGATKQGGLGGLLGRSQSVERFDPVPTLSASHFRSARTLAEREGLVFAEAMKPR